MKKLAIIGAGYLQLPLVQKAKEMGIQTYCFAWAEGAVCKDECDFFYNISTLEKDKILEKCHEIGIDGIITIASDIAVPTVCYVAGKLGLIGNSFNDSLASTNKYFMRQSFITNGVSSPAFYIVKSIENVPINDLYFPLIVKPTDRSGSRGVTKVDKNEQLMQAVERALSESISNSAIIEEYINGAEVSVETISWEGTHYILAITDKVTTGEPYFVEIEHHQPSNLAVEIQSKIKSEAKKALNALNFKYGAAHSEFKITNDNKVVAIEVGARMGGDFIGSDLVQLSTGYDFVKGVINISLGNFEEPIINENKYSGVYFLYKETRHILPIIKNSAKYSEIVAAGITDNELHAIQCSADRSGFFIYQSEKRFKINN